MAQLKSVGRRAFRHSAWLFARVLILPGVEEYLRLAFKEDPELDESLSDGEREQFRLARKIISDAYKLIDESALPWEMSDGIPPRVRH